MERGNRQKSYWLADKSGRRSPDHPVVRAAFAPFVRLLEELASDTGAKRLLDVGCGNGFLARPLDGQLALTGVDFSPAMLRSCPYGDRCLADACRLPFGDRSFDLVAAANLLHHLDEEARLHAVSEMIRVADKAVVSIEPNRWNPLVFTSSLLRAHERTALLFDGGYLARLFEAPRVRSISTGVSGWTAPNLSPSWWIGPGRILNSGPTERFGFYAYCVARLDQ